jgi:hypothetical protein
VCGRCHGNQGTKWPPNTKIFRFGRNLISTDSDFFGLSRSTRCGCCSYQVSSISVWRVTRYDHFCVFQFFSILAVSMAMAAILKIHCVCSVSSSYYYYYSFFLSSAKSLSDTFLGDYRTEINETSQEC